MNIKRNIVINLESRKKDGKLITENLPIRIRVMYAGQRIDIPTGYRIDALKWDSGKQRVKNGCTNKLQQSASDINSDLDKFSTDLQAIFKEYEVQDILPTIRQVRESFNKKQNKATKTKNSDNLIIMFEKFMDECSIKNNWTKSTIMKLATTKNHLKGFDKDLTLNAFSINGLSDFLDYLYLQDLRNSTINKIIEQIRWFLRWCRDNGHLKDSRFESFKPKFKTSPKKVIFLSWEELMQIRKCRIPKKKQHLNNVRDIFLFQCFTGLRYSDVYNLKKSDIKDNHIEITTIKTMDSLIIELNDYSRTILAKYKDADFGNNKVFPVISNYKMNGYLKTLAELAGINEPVRETYYKGNERIDNVTPKYALLGTHAGRRTFICNSLAMGIPAHTVMKWTGHSDYKAMKPYIAVADKDKKEAMQLWNKKENNKDVLLEQLKQLPQKQLLSLFKSITS